MGHPSVSRCSVGLSANTFPIAGAIGKRVSSYPTNPRPAAAGTLCEMDISEILVSAVVGATSGGAVGIWTAGNLAERSERGRQRAQARDQIRTLTEALRAEAIAGYGAARVLSTSTASYLQAEKLERYADEVMRAAGPLNGRDRDRITTRLAALVGAFTAASAADLAALPGHMSINEARGAYVLTHGEDLAKSGVDLSSNGLLGELRDHAASPDVAEETKLAAAIDELDRLLDLLRS
jgi:hypothetical protein